MEAFNKASTQTKAVLLGAVIIIVGGLGYYYYTTYMVEPNYVTLATWGGSWTDCFASSIEAFEEEYGVEVRIYTQASSGETVGKIRAEKDNPTIDLFFGGTHACTMVAQEGNAIDLSGKLSNLRLVDPMFYDEDNLPEVVQYLVNGHGWFYNPDALPEGLEFNESWTWFFDPAFEGKLAVPTPRWTSFTEQLSLVAGDYYDYKAGHELAKQLVQNIKVVYSSSPELEALFSSGEIWAANGIFADAKSLSESGLNIVTAKVWPVTAEGDSMCVVKGGNEDLALKLLNLLLEPEHQGAVCYYMGSTTTNINAPAPPAAIKPFLASPPEIVVVSDTGYLSEFGDAFFENWEREITPLLP